MVKIIFIEGNVASGKTSCLEFLQRELKNDKVIFIKEPVNLWQSLNIPERPESPESNSKINLLQEFYTDVPKYSFSFQTYVFLSRMQVILEKLKNMPETTEYIICERSVFTDREIFLKSLYNNGNITETERTVYCHLWDFWISLMQNYFDNFQISFLYIRCDPAKNLDHLKIRGRKEESEVTFEYLDELHKQHEALYGGDLSKLHHLVNYLIPNANFDVEIIDNSNNFDIFTNKITSLYTFSSQEKV